MPAGTSLALPVVFGRGQQLHRSARYGACQWIPHKVGPQTPRCMVGRDGIRHFIRRQYGRQRHASARYDAFPMHMMSGSTPAYSQAKFSVRPKSAISHRISAAGHVPLHICAASRRWGANHAASALHHRFEDKRCQFLVMLHLQFRSSVSRSSISPWKRRRGCGTK